MIYGIGIDIIEIDRIKSEIQKNGKFNRRVFTDQEIKYCERGANLNIQAQFYAGRFTAKEAFLKAIGTGLRGGLAWTDIQVTNDALGKPSLILANKALELINKAKISNIQLSISHSQNYATAIVVLEK